MFIELKNISKGYGEIGAHSFRSVLNNLSLGIEKGDRIAVVGPSGCGKTTLLNLMGLLDKPDEGVFYFDGIDVTRFSKKELVEFRNQRLGFIFQMHHLMPQLTLMENVLLPLLPKGRIEKEAKEWAEYLVKKVGVWEQRNQKPSEMSGGECQRTAVVRALINKPDLILADEPTGALDEDNAAALSEILLNLSREENITLVTVTHSEILAEKMDKKFVLKNGRF